MGCSSVGNVASPPLSLPHGSFCIPSLEEFSDVCIIPFIGPLIPRLGFGFGFVFTRLWEPHRLIMWSGSFMLWMKTLLLGCRGDMVVAGGVIVASFEGDFICVAIIGTAFSLVSSWCVSLIFLLFELWTSGSCSSVILFSSVVIVFGLCM